MVGVLTMSAVLSGCSSNSGHKPADTNTTRAKLEIKNGKYDPPVTITYLRPWGPDVKFKPGEDQDSNVHTKWAKEKLGIELRIQHVLYDNECIFCLLINRGNELSSTRINESPRSLSNPIILQRDKLVVNKGVNLLSLDT